MDQRGLEEVLSFCIEEWRNASDGWCINAQINIVKNKFKECKAKISMIPDRLTIYLKPLNISINKPFKDDEEVH